MDVNKAAGLSPEGFSRKKGITYVEGLGNTMDMDRAATGAAAPVSSWLPQFVPFTAEECVRNYGPGDSSGMAKEVERMAGERCKFFC